MREEAFSSIPEKLSTKANRILKRSVRRALTAKKSDRPLKEKRMKKTIFIISLTLALAFALGTATVQSQSGRGGYGSGMGSGYGMGPGMMGDYGGDRYSRGPDMMGGYGYDNGMGRGYGRQSQPPGKPLDANEAESMMKDYLNSTRNPNLKLGKINDEGRSFEAEILTKKDEIVDRVLIDKETGYMRSAY
jgi:hypothetical protein